MDSAKTAKAAAAAWLVKRDSGDWTEHDQAALNQWLDSSSAHTVAFLRLEAAWKTMGRLKSLGAGIPKGTVPPPGQWQLSTLFEARDARPSRAVSLPAKHPRWHVALAAGIATAVIAGAAWMLWPAGSSYQTPIGGVAFVPMADGSKVTLNTDSAIRVAITETERRVQLDRGEAFFEVVKDPSRPFVVVAGTKRVTAVGTAFSVRRGPAGIQVAVTDGKVRLDDTEAREKGNGAEGRAVLLAAGSIANSRDKAVMVREQRFPEVERDLSWRTGYLAFQDTKLVDAVAEFNRYSTHQIVLSDPTIGAIRVTGTFEATKYDAFVRLLEDGFAVRSQRQGDRIVLSKE